MPVSFATPSKQLSPFIKRYWAIENTLDSGETCIQRITPTGLAELLFYFTPRPRISDTGKHISDNAALYGQQAGFYDMELRGRLSVFSVVFQPQGLSSFFKFPLGEICNRNIPLDEIGGRIARELKHRMEDAGDFRQRVRIVEDYFSGLLEDRFDEFEFRRINRVVGLIQESQGYVEIGKLAGAACLGRRQFERVFSGQIGMKPMQYLRIIRFQCAIYYKQNRPELNMTELSYKSGYADQSHFINDFNALCGTTPRRYFSENTACSDFFG